MNGINLDFHVEKSFQVYCESKTFHEKSMKIGDIVIFKDQSKLLYKNALAGGIVMAFSGDMVILNRNNRPITVYPKEELRLLLPEDVKERGIEIV